MNGFLMVKKCTVSSEHSVAKLAYKRPGPLFPDNQGTSVSIRIDIPHNFLANLTNLGSLSTSHVGGVASYLS